MQTISLAAAAATGFFGVFLLAASGDAQTIPVSNASVAGGPHDAMLIATGEDEPIRPFHIKIPDFAPIDLHARIANTRWPDKETISDRRQGVHSPIGLAACMLDHDASSLALIARVFDCQSEGLTGIIDNAALYCLTDTAISSASLHWAKQASLFRSERCPDPGCRERVSRGDLCSSEDLDREDLSQTDLLQ